MYKITEIMDRRGNVKTDPDSLRRKGSIVGLSYVVKGDRAIMAYSVDNDGKEKSGCMVTSPVEEYLDTGKNMVIYTMNSMYCLKKLSE